MSHHLDAPEADHATSPSEVRTQTSLSEVTPLLNTAGLSVPYRSDEETMEMVRANHAAVRALRIVLRWCLMLPRHGAPTTTVIEWTVAYCTDD